MKYNFYILILASFFAAFLLSCSDNNVIEEEKFIKIYTDMIIVQDSIGNKPEKLDSLKSEIFKNYDTDQAQYEATIKYYNQDSERWRKFFEKAMRYVETLKSKNPAD